MPSAPLRYVPLCFAGAFEGQAAPSFGLWPLGSGRADPVSNYLPAGRVHAPLEDVLRQHVAVLLLAGRVGFRASYALVAAVVAAPALVMPFWTSNGISSRTATPREETLLDQFRGLMGNRLLWRVALLQAAAISCNSAFLVYIVLLVVDTLAGTPRLASMLIAAQGGAFVAIMLCGGGLLDRCRLRGLYAAAFLAQAAGLLMCGTLSTGWLLGAGAVAFGLGTGLVTTISFSRLGKMTGEKGKLAGLFFLVTGAGVALGPIWGGLLVQMWGVRAAFTGFVPVVLAALLAVTLPVREAAVVAGEQAVPS